jgi:hypothetical protein
VSNENPFAAPGSDAGAPLQPPAVEQPQVPAFGAAALAAPTAPPGVAQAPYPGPFPAPGMAAPYGYAGIPAAPLQPIKPNRGLAVALIILSAIYAVLCLVEVFALAHRVSLANQVINDPASVSLDQADAADGMVSLLSIVALVVFLAAIVLVVVWQRSIRKSFGPTGRYQAVLKESGYVVFRIVWIITIVLSLFLRGGSYDTPQEVITHDHESMVYYGLRAVLGLLLIYLAIRLARTIQRNLTLVQAGYSPDAVNYLSS